MSSAIIGQQLQNIFNHTSIQGCNGYSKNIFNQLYQCHTAEMGYHYYECSDPQCRHVHCQYHSCGNRHCPNCGGLKKEQWIENLTAQLFPTAYYHVVFTVPHEFNSLIPGNRKQMFTLLFKAACQTLLQFSADPQYLGASCGVTSVLHTWGIAVEKVMKKAGYKCWNLYAKAPYGSVASVVEYWGQVHS